MTNTVVRLVMKDMVGNSEKEVRHDVVLSDEPLYWTHQLHLLCELTTSSHNWWPKFSNVFFGGSKCGNGFPLLLFLLLLLFIHTKNEV